MQSAARGLVAVSVLVLGAIGAIPAIGAPGCARSPKENGFDWVLNRILAGIALSGARAAFRVRVALPLRAVSKTAR